MFATTNRWSQQGPVQQSHNNSSNTLTKGCTLPDGMMVSLLQLSMLIADWPDGGPSCFVTGSSLTSRPESAMRRRRTGVCFP